MGKKCPGTMYCQISLEGDVIDSTEQRGGGGGGSTWTWTYASSVVDLLNLHDKMK